MLTTRTQTTGKTMRQVPRWVFHRDIRQWINRIHEFIDAVGRSGVDEVDDIWMRMGMKNMPLVDHGGYYTCPILSPEVCQRMVDLGTEIGFKPNDDEEAAYQIPEIILKDYSIDTHNSLAAVGRELLWPLFHLIHGAAPNHFSSIQLARYEEGDTVATGWHNDTDSECSAVISLAPHLHTGGGTALRPCGALAPAVIVPPLPVGHALLFNGRATLHRGLPLVTGQRNLLVYWMVNNTNVEKWKYD